VHGRAPPPRPAPSDAAPHERPRRNLVSDEWPEPPRDPGPFAGGPAVGPPVGPPVPGAPPASPSFAGPGLGAPPPPPPPPPPGALPYGPPGAAPAPGVPAGAGAL